MEETRPGLIDVQYRSVADATPFKGPKGKLPWIEHEERRAWLEGMRDRYFA